MNTKDLIRLGVPLGAASRRATDFVSKFILAGGDKTRLEEELKAVLANPSAFTEDSLRGELAKALLNAPPPPRAEPIKYRQWGEGLEHEAVMQMERACLLPVAVAGALMPDAHVGYGLPIGGVLATENTVIPYAVGVDIACRMKMTVLDVPARDLERHQDRLTRAIEAETRFGIGASFKHRRQHEVLDADWDVSPVTKQNKDRAWSQLGTSGSGNHFVEFGLFTAHGEIHGLAPGTYVALLSHSGSRGTGAAVCDHYSKLAFSQFPDLPSELKRLAWLSLDSQDGQEYWAAMELMGRYAAANHALIHKHVAANLGAEGLLDLERSPAGWSAGDARCAAPLRSRQLFTREQQKGNGVVKGMRRLASGDLVFSRTGELLGVMANSTYCMMIKNFNVTASFQFAQDVRNQHTGETLARLYSLIARLPYKLQ